MPEESEKQYVSVIRTRYLEKPMVTFAATAPESDADSVWLEDATEKPAANDDIYFVFVLYTVAVGPYSFAGQYHLHRAFKSQKKAKQVLDAIKQSGEVPDGIIYSGDPTLENVYSMPAKYTQSKKLMDAIQADSLAKKRAKVTKREQLVAGGLSEHTTAPVRRARPKYVPTRSKARPAARRIKPKVSSGRRK
jgi:hypothetical protein